MTKYTVWGSKADMTSPRYLCEGVARDAFASRKEDLGTEQLRVSAKFEFNHDINVVSYTAKVQDQVLKSDWFYRQREAFDDICGKIREAGSSVGEAELTKYMTVLNVKRYRPVKLPIVTRFTAEKRPDGKIQYSTRLNLHPEKDGYSTTGKLFFPTRAWKNVDGLPMVIDGIEKDKETYGFVYGHPKQYPAISRTKLLQLILEDYRQNHEVAYIGDTYLVEKFDDRRGSRWFIVCDRGMVYKYADLDEHGAPTLISADSEPAYAGRREWQALPGVTKQVLRLTDTILFDKGYADEKSFLKTLCGSNSSWSFRVIEGHLRSSRAVCALHFECRELTARFYRAPMDMLSSEDSLYEPVVSGLLTMWTNTAFDLRYFSVIPQDIICALAFTTQEVKAIVEEVQRRNDATITRVKELVQRGKLKIDGV